MFFPAHLAYRYGPLYCFIGYNPALVSNYEKMLILILYQSLPIVLGSLISLKSYLNVINQLKELPKCIIEDMNIKVYSLLWYPLVLFVSLIPCQIYTAIELYSNPPLWAKFIHLMLPHSIGLTNLILYGYQRKLYHATHDGGKFDLTDANDHHESLVSEQHSISGSSFVQI